MIFNKSILRFTVPLLHFCNLKCDYCHVPNERHEYMSLNTFKKGVDFFYSTKGKYKNIVLYGGEPLLLENKILEEIIDYTQQNKKLYPDKSIEVTLVTNLTILKRDIIPTLEKVDNLCISIDGKKENHDVNRGLFEKTYENFQIIRGSGKIMRGATINKVVNKKNVKTFFEDVIYLLEEFGLPISYNQALSVQDWDDESVLLLEFGLKKVYEYASEKGNYHMFQNFFKIPMKSCPFGTLSMSLEGKIYNCEFIANDYVNITKPLFDLITWKSLRLDIKDCYYDVSNPRCIDESCLKCGTTCVNFSFQAKKELLPSEENILRRVKRARSLHQENYKKLLSLKYKKGMHINVKVTSFKNVFLLMNFFYTFKHHLDFGTYNLYIDYDVRKIDIFIKILRLLIKKTNTNIDFVIEDRNVENDIFIDLEEGTFFYKGKYFGSLESELFPFFL